jgi:hypothetical protein
MPSIKIRKTPSRYQLPVLRGSFDGDGIEVSSQSIRPQRSLGTFPRRGLQMTASSEYQPRKRSYTTSGVSCSSQIPASYSRSRSRNRVTEHILAPRVASVAPPPLSDYRPPALDSHVTIRDRTVIMHGSQTDIIMHTQTDRRTPDIFASVHSLEQSQQFNASDVHHHDDIVDHLDVIGIMELFWS